MSDRTAEILKALIRGARTAPRADEPLVDGTSLHSEDVDFLLRELQARHGVELLPNEPPAALEEKGKKAGKGAAAAPARRSSAGPTSPGEDKDQDPEESAEDASRTRRLKLRLARLELEISKLTKGKK